jgi:hypothetical protein
MMSGESTKTSKNEACPSVRVSVSGITFVASPLSDKTEVGENQWIKVTNKLPENLPADKRDMALRNASMVVDKIHKSFERPPADPSMAPLYEMQFRDPSVADAKDQREAIYLKSESLTDRQLVLQVSAFLSELNEEIKAKAASTPHRDRAKRPRQATPAKTI